MPPPTFIFSCNPSYTYKVPTLVIQNLELQHGPDGQIVHGNLTFLQEAKISLEPAVPNNLILPSPSMICAYPLRRLLQVAPATHHH